MRAAVAAVGLALIAAALTAVGAHAAGPIVIGGRVMLQFQGTVTAQWSIRPSPHDDGCYVRTVTGSGTQTLVYHTHGRRAAMALYEDRASLTVTLPPSESTSVPRVVLPGYGRMDIKRSGVITASFQKSASWTSACPSQPADVSASTSGCGEAHIPWDSYLEDVRGTLTVDAVDYPPARMLSDCPWFDPTPIQEDPNDPSGQFPASTKPFPLATIRRKLARVGGRLTIQGRQSWHSDDRRDVDPLLNDIGAGSSEVVATESATWRYTLVRASGHFSK